MLAVIKKFPSTDEFWTTENSLSSVATTRIGCINPGGLLTADERIGSFCCVVRCSRNSPPVKIEMPN
jgi:hypothetical protein